jgi:glutathione reductase (NADPH)
MADYDFDFFVIGAGSGGVRAARMAAGYGAKVAVAEQSALGGTCVNVGCVPKKLFVYASQFSEELEDARGFGWDAEATRYDWQRLLQNKNEEIARLNGIYARLLDNAGVQRIEGRATFVDAHTVTVGDQKYSARYILVAVGGQPRLPTLEGVELGITSNEAFFLEELPERMVICGGGYIASEFACIFHGLGVKVTQLYRGPLFLRGFDDDIRTCLAEEMRNKGIDLRFDCNLTKLEKHGELIRAHLTEGDPIDCGQVMLAIGRDPNTGSLGLDKAGVELDAAHAIIVDGYSRSSVEHIYAVGDVTRRIELTPVALAEGSAVAATLFGDGPTKPDHSCVPSAIFTQPEAATVGLSEGTARKTHAHVDVYRSRFIPLKHTLSGRTEKTMMKLVVDADNDRVLGCHMVGPHAGDVIQGFAVAMKCGATKAQFDATIGIHPTSAEEFVTMRSKVE